MATNPGDEKPSGTAYQNYVNVESPSATAPNAAAVTTPVIIQYPKPPRRDDGKWAAIGSMVGSVLGLLYSKDLVKKAKSAESKWNELTDGFYDDGKDIKKWADTLRSCDDKLHDALCAFALCSYKADYEGIQRRAYQAAQVQAAKAYRIATKTSDRYHTGINRDVRSGILKASILATVSAVTQAYETERDKAFRYRWDTLSKATQIFESDYLNRARLSADYLSGAGTNYGFLAQSYRQTAKMDVGDFAAIGAVLATLLPLAFSFGCSSDSYCDDGCGSSDSGAENEQTDTSTGE